MLASPDIHVVDITSYPDQHAEPVHRRGQARASTSSSRSRCRWSGPTSLRMKKAVEAARRARRASASSAASRRSFSPRRASSTPGLLGQLHYGEVDYYHGIGPWYGPYRWNTKKSLGGSALLTAGCHALDALLLCMGVGGRGGHELRDAERAPDLPRLRIPDDLDDDSAVQERQRGEVRRGRRLLPAVLLSHAPRRQRGQPARQQVPLAEARRAQPQRVEPAVDEDARQRRRERSSLPDAVPGVLRRASTPGKEMPLTSFADAFDTHRVIAAADKSAAEKRPVKLAEIPWPRERIPVTCREHAAGPRDCRASRRHRVRHGRDVVSAARGRLGHSLPEPVERQPWQHDAVAARNGAGASPRSAGRRQGDWRRHGIRPSATISRSSTTAGRCAGCVPSSARSRRGVILTHSPRDYMEDHMNTSRLAVTAAFARAHPGLSHDPGAKARRRTGDDLPRQPARTAGRPAKTHRARARSSIPPACTT